jgi:hypothetical protein
MTPETVGGARFTLSGATRAPGPAGRRPSRHWSAALRLALLGAIAVAVAVAAGAGSATPRATRTFSVYAVAANEVYINNTDSAARGVGNNPSGKRWGSAANLGNETTNGPFPGDEGLYSFTLYGSRSLGDRIGSALYTCQYYFNKNGFCDATFQLGNSTLIGAGIINFTARQFAMAIVGGEGTDASASGDVEATASGPQAQRLLFTLTRS